MQDLSVNQGCHVHVCQVHFGGDNTDAFYIPSRLAQDFALGILLFASQEIPHEVVIPAVLGVIAESTDDYEVRHSRCAFFGF